MSVSDRRSRIHALVLGLLASQPELGLLEEEISLRGNSNLDSGSGSGWLECNRRLVQRYQALVRTAVTLDALIEQEITSDPLAGD